MNVREKLEKIEVQILSPNAALSQNSKGRLMPDEQCNLRTVYQVDRDRVIHSKAFRRLKHKTQVFICPRGDHYRTRLTHTLEVSQIARTIAKSLFLNEDLTEAIALAHDLGHTPFGHDGEVVLNELSDCGFKHFEQSLRVVDFLEKDGKGLNLTAEVRDGILNHTRGDWPETLEGKAVRWADRIAYVNHDIDDAIRANVMKFSDIPSDIIDVLGQSKTNRINTLINSIVENSNDDILCMSEEVQKSFDKLHSFMYDFVYTNMESKKEAVKVPAVITGLFDYFISHSDKLPYQMKLIAEKEGLNRAVCDYIAGMTDYFAINFFENIFIPKSWNI